VIIQMMWLTQHIGRCKKVGIVIPGVKFASILRRSGRVQL
jgi:hypothetical protein